MSAQPIHDHDPRDPQAILAALPEGVRDRFLEEYHQAVDGAHDPAGYRGLQNMLQLWYLRALAYTKPDYEQRMRDIQEGAGTYYSLDEVIAHYEAANSL